jgi:pyridoxal phosphate enzyme (YggS family)
MVNKHSYSLLKTELDKRQIMLVAVSKTKPTDEILELYHLGQRDFGENYVQELVIKANLLPPDIRWHFIGHLQTNKVKLIAPFVQLIQAVDSLKLLEAINKEGAKTGRKIDCLLQVHIAREETKFGLDEKELDQLVDQLTTSNYDYVRIRGLMGMASFTEDWRKIRGEYRFLKSLFDKHAQLRTPNFELRTLSMGMSADYTIAVEEGSTMVRIGSLLFGERSKD